MNGVELREEGMRRLEGSVGKPIGRFGQKTKVVFGLKHHDPPSGNCGIVEQELVLPIGELVSRRNPELGKRGWGDWVPVSSLSLDHALHGGLRW